VTAIISALSEIPVHADVAMTGEVNLRGKVTAIGGVKEKLLGAMRGGIKTVLIPEENEKDLADVPDKIKKGLKIIPVKTIEEVFAHALSRQPEPLNGDSVKEIGEISSKTAENKAEDVIRH